MFYKYYPEDKIITDDEIFNDMENKTIFKFP